MADLFNTFEDIDNPIAMLCIDSVFVGCYLYREGHKKAATKLIETALAVAGMNKPSMIRDIFNDIEQSLNTLRAHRELHTLNMD